MFRPTPACAALLACLLGSCQAYSLLLPYATARPAVLRSTCAGRPGSGDDRRDDRFGRSLRSRSWAARSSSAVMQVQSPFDSGQPTEELTVTEEELVESANRISGPLALTMENVDVVLDEMRPYLIADGGNVAVRDIDGGIVKLELQGACGSCPSSTMTMKMGLERGLREKIPEIISVVQVAPESDPLSEEGIEEVLEEIRPFLKMAGGTVDLVALDATGIQPTATLAITGNGATINSVRVEIASRLKRNFPTLANVVWE